MPEAETEAETATTAAANAMAKSETKIETPTETEQVPHVHVTNLIDRLGVRPKPMFTRQGRNSPQTESPCVP